MLINIYFISLQKIPRLHNKSSPLLVLQMLSSSKFRKTETTDFGNCIIGLAVR